jgi:hypothetical protein
MAEKAASISCSLSALKVMISVRAEHREQESGCPLSLPLGWR